MKQLLLYACLLWSLVIPPEHAQAPAYPSKPVRIIISFPPGGSTDLLARLLAEKLQAGMQQSVIVENRPGGNFVIAAEAVAKSPPDGYTLFLAVDSTMSVNPMLYSKWVSARWSSATGPGCSPRPERPTQSSKSSTPESKKQ